MTMLKMSPWIACAAGPFVLAICFTVWGVAIGEKSPNFATMLFLVAIPCGLLGMSASLIIALIRSYESRIAALERRLGDG